MNVKKFFVSCLGFLLCLSLSAEEKKSRLSLPTLSASEETYFEMLVEGNNRFAFDLYQQMSSQPGNLYFSSYSIVSGLGMVAIGAKRETAHQFQHAFHYSLPLLLFTGDLNEWLQRGNDSKRVQVLLANGLWLDKSVKVFPFFTQTMKRNFRFALQPVDFSHSLSQSLQIINQWTSKQTEGKINNLVSSQDVKGGTKMLLTTAAYLKGSWAYPFDRKLNKRQPFKVSEQRSFTVEMMQNISHYLLWKGDQWDVLAIPYDQEGDGVELAMAILLPKKEVTLLELEKKMTAENWRQWKNQLRKQLVTLMLPSFQIDKRLDLNTSLKALGFNQVFNSHADFSEMTEEKGIYLNTAIHRASIKIDEKGSNFTNSISTKATTLPTKGGETPYEFIADRPFIFIIWDQKTDSILFMGRLTMP